MTGMAVVDSIAAAPLCGAGAELCGAGAAVLETTAKVTLSTLTLHDCITFSEVTPQQQCKQSQGQIPAKDAGVE